MAVSVKNILDEIVTYLAAQGYGTVGVDITPTFMKDLPNAYIGVYSSGGPKIDIANRLVRFQIVVRNNNKEAAFTEACNIYNEFRHVANVLDTVKGIIKADSEVGEPFTDAKNNTKYSLNFHLRRTGN